MTISTELLEVLKKPHTESALLRVSPTSGASFDIENSRIMQGGLAIDRYCTAGQFPEIGNATASELTVTLDNRDGYFDDRVFAGARVYVSVTVSDGTSTFTLPQGYFTVDNSPRRQQIITLTALDDLARFDRAVDNTIYEMTVAELVRWCCTKCGVTEGGDISGFTNSGLTIALPESLENLTYRQLIIWCAEITGTCAYIDENARLRFGFYRSGVVSDSGSRLTPSMRFSSALHPEDRLDLRSLRLVSGDTEYAYGTSSGGVVFVIEGNDIIPTDQAESVAQAIYSNLSVGARYYYPFEAQTISLPTARPLDFIAYVTSDGTAYSSYITHCTWRLNGRTDIKAAGTSEERTGYASTAPFTAREKAVIQQIAANTARDDLPEINKALLSLNELITNSMGLYMTGLEQIDGSVKYYAHDRPALEDSSTIYTMTDNGFAWTNDGWNDGEPIWNYGITADGNAVLNAVTTYKIVADAIYGGTLTLGGKSNGNGVMTVLDENGGQVVRIDKDGLMFSFGDKSLTAESITDEFADIEAGVSDNAASITTLEQTANGLSSRVSTAEGDITILEQTSSSITARIEDAEGNISILEQTVNGFETRITNAEGDASDALATAEALVFRVSTAEGDISTLEQTANGLSSRVSTAEGTISTVSQTANKVNWLIKSGTSSSNFTLTDRAISLVADNIDLTGYVTFSALSTAGQTTINGSNITTGSISASRIGANNGSYITFGSPIYMSTTYPQIYGLDAIYFNGTSRNCVIYGNNENIGLNVVQIRATGGLYYHNGTYNYPIVHSGNIASYVTFQ